MEIRDSRNGDWYWVNNIVLACKSISLADKAVYSALATFSGYQEIRPTFETIAKRCDVGVRTAKESIKMLEAMGFIFIENHGRKGTANVYKLCKSVNGCVKKCSSCTSIKKCKPLPEEVQITTESSAVAAPQIDRYIDNINTSELENSQSISPSKEEYIPTDEEGNIIPQPKPRKFDPRPIFKLFPDYKEGWIVNKTERKYAEYLSKERGVTKIKSALNFYQANKEHESCPLITKPSELYNKWDNLKNFRKKNL